MDISSLRHLLDHKIISLGNFYEEEKKIIFIVLIFFPPKQVVHWICIKKEVIQEKL